MLDFYDTGSMNTKYISISSAVTKAFVLSIINTLFYLLLACPFHLGQLGECGNHEWIVQCGHRDGLEARLGDKTRGDSGTDNKSTEFSRLNLDGGRSFPDMFGTKFVDVFVKYFTYILPISLSIAPTDPLSCSFLSWKSLSGWDKSFGIGGAGRRLTDTGWKSLYRSQFISIHLLPKYE